MSAPVTGTQPIGPVEERPLARLWAGLRWYASGVIGGSKYEGYLSWHARHGEGPPLSEKDYWRHRAEHEERNPQGRCC